jgi:hypothetical protein
MLSAIPWIGKDLVEFIWGGFSVARFSCCILGIILFFVSIGEGSGFWRFKPRVHSSVIPAYKRANRDELAWIVGIACKVGAFIIVSSRGYSSQRFEIKVQSKDLPVLIRVRDLLGIGTISEPDYKGYVYFNITDECTLLWNHIVPIFDLIPCPTYHHGMFLIWRAKLEARVDSTLLPCPPSPSPGGGLAEPSAELCTLDYFDAFLVGYLQEPLAGSFTLPRNTKHPRAEFSLEHILDLPLMEAIRERLGITGGVLTRSTGSYVVTSRSVVSIQSLVSFLREAPVQLAEPRGFGSSSLDFHSAPPPPHGGLNNLPRFSSLNLSLGY